ncbi:MAG: ferrous iron transport protein A [Pseudohongiellaceae bacterium]|jgi:ferrous iron transport protein A
MAVTSLDLADIGDHCLVLEVSNDNAELQSRLYALGVIPGAVVKILRFAPLGDPMQVKVGGSFISIRKTEAAIIQVDTQ